jgi:hypothetical protein
LQYNNNTQLQKEKGENTMSKKRETIVEITKKLRCMDFNSVVVMKTAADILAAKERLDRESAEERKRA